MAGSAATRDERLAVLRGDAALTGSVENVPSLDFELNWAEYPDVHDVLHLLQPPELPDHMSPGQAAQLSEIFEYLHLQSRNLVQSISLPEGQSHVKFNLAQWQDLLDLQAQIAEFLRKVGGPESE